MPGRGPQDRRPAAMIPDLRREALAALAEVLALSPDVRNGQLLAHLGFLGGAHPGEGVGSTGEDELLAILTRQRGVRVARGEGTPTRTPRGTGAATPVSGSPALGETAP